MSITKYQVAALTYKPYIKAMSPENLISSFRKTGIFPFNNKVITNDQTAPSIIYTDAQEDETDTHIGCAFFLGFFVDIGLVSLDFLADDCKISRLDFFMRSPARYGGINLRLSFFTQPIELKDVVGVVLVKWGECSVCSHWTHLTYCTEVTVLRRNSVLKCPHCSSE
jgi:hypothetical protein